MLRGRAGDTGLRRARYRRRKLALLLACAAACMGGGRLPEYAQPTGRVLEPGELDASDTITYRALAREDFRGADPPAHFAPFRDQIGAATCAYVVSTPETGVALVPIAGDGVTAYEARFAQLGFLAVMDRRCSWWNDAQTVLPPDYVLEHEQIHFALFEVEARRLDARSAEIMARTGAVASTPAAAAAEVERAVKQELEAALRSALERNRAFDEETSFGHSPELQRRWRARVERELTETVR